MSALKNVIAALDRDRGFQLMSDMPLFKGALAEIDARLTALEHPKPAGVPKPGPGGIDPRLVTTPPGVAGPGVGSPVPPSAEA